MDTNTMLMLAMMMGSGGSNNNMMLLFLMMSGMLGGTTGSNTLTQALTPESMAIGMLPGIGTLGKYMIGGVGAVLAGSMFKRKRRRRYYRRPRTIVRNYYRRGRY